MNLHPVDRSAHAGAIALVLVHVLALLGDAKAAPPASQPASQPASRPASQPVVRPASRPASPPAVQPASPPPDRASPAKKKPTELYDLSLQDLLNTRVSVASKQEESISASPAIVTTVNMRDMRRMGLRTLKDALELVPNVVVAETPVGSSSVSIRGLSETFNQKVLFLLDGVPYWMSSHGDIPLLGMPLRMIEKIEIIRGPGSVVYGTNASAGVINVILRKNADASEVAVSGGGLGEVRAEGNASYSHDGGYSFLGASFQRQQTGYVASYPKTLLVPPFSGAKAPFPTLGTQRKLEQSASLAAGLRHRGLDLLFHVFESELNGLGGAPVIIQPNTLTYFGMLAHVGYTRQVDDLELSAGLDHNIFFLQLEIQNFLGSVDPDGQVHGDPGKQQYSEPLLNNSRTRFYLNGKYSITNSLALFSGLEGEVRRAGKYVKTDGFDEVLATQSEQTDVMEVSTFAQLSWQIWRLQFVLGLRFVHNGLAGTHLAPRMAAVLNLSSRQAVKLLYSEGFNSPVISQQDLTIPFVVSGNRDLMAEIVRTIELGYVFASPRLLLSFNGYAIVTDDVITRTKEPGDKQPVYRNVDGYWRLGGEADLQLSLAADKSRWLENIKLIANVSYNHGGDTEVDDDPLLKLVPKLQANLGVTWTLFERHTLGASQRLLSPRSEVGWQHITTLAYTFNYKVVELSVSLFNVAGSTIEDPDINSNQIPVVPGGPGRTVFGSAAYRF